MKKYQKIRSTFTLVLLIILILSSCNKVNQESEFKQESISHYANIDNIDEENLLSVVKELSSEKYKDRLTGTKENEMTAQYIRILMIICRSIQRKC